MSERSRSFLQESRRKVGNSMVDRIGRDLKRKYGTEAFYRYPEKMFTIWNVEPKYTGDLSHREQLRQDSGVVFSNHPSGLDVPVVMEALKDNAGKIRSDFKVIVGSAAYNQYCENYGGEHFFPATRDPGKAPKVFAEISDFIRSGGLFLIFPGNHELETRTGKLEFENGLTYLLATLEPETMAYTFGINTTDAKKIKNPERRYGVLAETFISQKLNTNKNLSKLPLRVAERYSQCGEWQNIMNAESGNRWEQSRLLTQHYSEVHKDNL